MKHLLLFAVVILLWSCQSNSVSNGSPDEFVISRGTNLAHFLSQTNLQGSARDTLFQEKDIIAIKQLGFDYIRLPIDEDQLWNENGDRHPDAFRSLINCLDWCMKHQLKVIVDMHTLRSHAFEFAENPLMIDEKEQEKYYLLWTDLSSTLQHYSLSDVAYELLNAPYALDPEQWNYVVANIVKTLREQEPERVLLIGSNMYQSPLAFSDLKIPDDKNLMLSFQFWEPFLLTFYKAEWSEFKDYTGPVNYPGQLVTSQEYQSLSAAEQNIVQEFVGVQWDRQKMEEMIQVPLSLAKEYGIRVVCAEYGISVDAPQDDKIRWYNDIISLFNKHGIAASIWNYKSDDMGLVNSNNEVNNAVVKAILKKE